MYILVNRMRALAKIGLLAIGLLYITSTSYSQVVVPLGDDFFVIPTNRSNITSQFDSSAFDYVRRDEAILTGFPVGHDLPKATNELFYNLLLDGYGGQPFGSCLRRGYLLPNTDPSKELCTRNENRDLMRVWANRNPNLKSVLLKNMTIKNAFRTYNVVDGDVVTRSSELPHTDTFQSFYVGSSVENPDWLVIQDTIIKNSDNSLMIHGGGRFGGAVYQNLQTACEQGFKDDDLQRHLNDYAQFLPNETPRPSFSCTNSVTFSSTKPAPVWLINIATGGAISILNENAKVIVVGDQNAELSIRTRDSRRRLVPHSNVHRYPTIEAALNSNTKPPYIEFSCSGWNTKPNGCESRIGAFVDS